MKVTARNTNAIERINTTPMEALRFKDFLRLKVGGHDEFSAIRGRTLESKVSQDILVTIREVFPHDRKSLHSTIRWVMRGLEITRAIRKVRTDLEVAENANYAREEQDFWESDGAADFAIDVLLDGDELEDIIHPQRQTELQIAGYTIVRSAPNLATVVSSDGEVLIEKEINNDHHWQNFLRKFRESEQYRKQLTSRE